MIENAMKRKEGINTLNKWMLTSYFLFITLVYILLLANISQWEIFNVLLIISSIIAIPLLTLYGKKLNTLFFAAFPFLLQWSPSKNFYLIHLPEHTFGIRILVVDVLILLFFCIVTFSCVKEKSAIKKGIIVNPVFLCCTGWVLWNIISSYNAENIMLALTELSQIIRCYLLFVLVIIAKPTKKQMLLATSAFLFSLFIQSLLLQAEYIVGKPLLTFPGMPQYSDVVTEGYRPGGVMGHSSNYAKLACFALPVLLIKFMLSVGSKERISLMAGVCSIFLSLLLTMSRAGILMAFFGFVLSTFFVKKLRYKKGNVVFLMLVITFGVLSFCFTGERIIERFTSDSGAASIAIRPLMYENALKVISKHYIMGTGLNSYTIFAPRYDQTGVTKVFNHPCHNIFLLNGAEIGMPGMVFYILLLVSAILFFLKSAKTHADINEKAMYYGLAVGTLCSWFQGLIGWGHRSFFGHHLYLMLFLGMALARNGGVSEQKGN